MANILLYLTIFIVSVQAFDGFNPFDDHIDDPFIKNTLPTPKTNLFEVKTSTKVPPPRTLTPFHGMNFFERLMKELEEKQQQQRRKVEAWIMGVPSAVGMMNAAQTGPQCSACSSYNLNACAKVAKTIRCGNQQQCYTVHLTHKASDTNSVIKGCIDKTKCEEDVCEKIKLSSKDTYKNCKMQCCKGDMCNKHDIPKPLPKPPGPTGSKCFTCDAHDEESCLKQGSVRQCADSQQCAAVLIVQKSGNHRLLAKGCIAKTICEKGLCPSLLKSGRYSSCRGSCCKGEHCSVVNSTAAPPSIPATTQPAVPSAVKCYSCLGSNKNVCDKKLTIKQCEVGERCYEGGASLKGTKQSTYARGCTKHTEENCKMYCKTLESRLVNCTYECCSGNLCNKPSKPITQPPTQRPVTEGKGLWCAFCRSDISEEQCESTQEVRQCPSGQHCYFGQIKYHNGKTFIGKDCREPETCSTACDLIGPDAKSCNMTCCKEDHCNRQIVKPTPTKIPVKNPNIRALLKLIESFKVLLEAIENSIRVSAKDYKASNYKDQIASLIAAVDHHTNQVGSKKSPMVRNAQQQLLELRTRADEALKKLGDSDDSP